MVDKIITLSVFILFSLSSYSQIDFRAGYIVKNNNDTIYGLIDYKGNISNAARCIFKKDDSSSPTSLAPLQIKAYRFEDSKCYVSKYVEFDGKEEYKFLEYLVNGVVDVFYFRDALGEHYFVEDDDGRLMYLNNETKEITVNDTKYIKESNEYKGLLRYTFKESPTISRQLDNFELSHKSLINIADSYHSEICSSEKCVIYEKVIPNLKWSFGGLVGLNAVSMSFNNALSLSNKYLKYSPLSTDFFIAVGLFVKVNMPGLDERFFLQLEGTYNERRIETDHKAYKLQANNENRSSLKFTSNSINNAIILRYEFPRGNLRPVFQGGFFTNYLFNSQYQATIIGSNGYRTEINKFGYKDLYYPFGQFEMGVTLGVGLLSKMIHGRDVFADLRVQRGMRLSKGISSDVLLLNLGIQLNK